MSRIAAGINRLWDRQMPYGLVSVAFLNPWAAKEVVWHRQFFCRGIANAPRPVIFVLNIGLWCRWVAWYSWREAKRCLLIYGDGVAQKGVGKSKQYSACMRLALFHCIPPAAYYQYRFYENGSPKAHWQYLYGSELVAYHHGGVSSSAAAQRQLLANKHQFASRMHEFGVAVAQGVLLPSGSVYQQLTLCDSRRFYLKPVCGSQSRGVFQLDFNTSGPVLRDFSDVELSGSNAVDKVNSLFQLEDYLLQPRYFNHPGFDGLDNGTDEVIVLRIITWRLVHEYRLYCAYLEIPVVVDNVKRGYLFVQVDTDTGAVVPGSLDSSVLIWSKLADQFKQRLQGFAVPFWEECVANNLLAHQQLGYLKAVAWDNVVTREGALILEGNSNWSVELPQVFLGGLQGK